MSNSLDMAMLHDQRERIGSEKFARCTRLLLKLQVRTLVNMIANEIPTSITKCFGVQLSYKDSGKSSTTKGEETGSG